MRGWIRLPRVIQRKSFWKSNRPYDTRSAFIYLLLTAAHEKHDINFDNDYMIVDEGEIITSLKQLAQEWGWSLGKVTKYLQGLSKAGEIQFKSTTKMTRIKILTWNDYQWDKPTESQTVEPGTQNQNEIKMKTEWKQNETYNNVNQVNNDNKKEDAQILKFVRAKKGYDELTEEEKQIALECANFYEQMLKSKIDFNKLCILVYGSEEDKQTYGFGDWQTLRKALGYLSKQELTHKVLHPYYYIWSLSRQKDFVEKMRKLTGSHSEESRYIGSTWNPADC
jgi:hypothetical protein